MSDTYTPNLKLPIPAVGDRSWSVPNDARVTILDALAPVGSLYVSSHEQPSSSLLIDVAAGAFVDQSGAVQTYAGVSGQAIALSSSKVLYLDGTASWSLVVAASYPSTPHVRLASVVTGVATITSITDNRQCFPVAGSIADGVNFTFGTTTGTKFGTTTTGKVGFFGKAPIVQPTIGAGTAGATWTSTEQAMLQAVFNAVRNLGLGS